MRSLIICFVILLAGCNQGTNNVPYSDPALVAKVDALTKALADATHEQAQQAKSLSSLQLIGKVHGMVNAAGVSIPNFGPCTDMGVLIGRGGDKLSSPLASELESFQTCTGYSYTVSAFDGSIQLPSYVAWDGPNCTGNMLIETDISGNGFNPQVASGGVVFAGPLDGVVYMVRAGQTPELRTISSSLNTDGGTCGPDTEQRMTVSVEENDSSVSGVPNQIPTPFSITAP